MNVPFLLARRSKSLTSSTEISKVIRTMPPATLRPVAKKRADPAMPIPKPKPKPKPKPQKAPEDELRERLNILNNAIAIHHSNPQLKNKHQRKLERHLVEKGVVERQLAALGAQDYDSPDGLGVSREEPLPSTAASSRPGHSFQEPPPQIVHQQNSFAQANQNLAQSPFYQDGPYQNTRSQAPSYQQSSYEVPYPPALGRFTGYGSFSPNGPYPQAPFGFPSYAMLSPELAQSPQVMPFMQPYGFQNTNQAYDSFYQASWASNDISPQLLQPRQPTQQNPEPRFVSQQSTNAPMIPGLNLLNNYRPTQSLTTPQMPTGPRAFSTSSPLDLKRTGFKRPGRDEIVPPSALSGGIPEPHPQYLQQAASPTSTSPTRVPILLVIDLNGTLLHRPDRFKPFTFQERTLAQHFLSYALSNFSVMVWSSARPQNVEKMCEKLFASPTDRSKLVAVWARDKMGLTPDDYNKRVQVYKRLDLVWGDEAVKAQNPDFASGGRWSQANTVLIDDSVEKARSEPYNLIEVPEFGGKAVKEPPNVLRHLAEYLEGLATQRDVSAYIHKTPFKIA